MLPVQPVLVGFFNIGLLFAFVTTHQQQDQALTCLRVINSITWSPIDSGFTNALANGFHVPKITTGHSTDANQNSGSGLSVGQVDQPLGIRIIALRCQVVTNFKNCGL